MCVWRGGVSVQTLCCVNKRSDVHGLWHLRGVCPGTNFTKTPRDDYIHPRENTCNGLRSDSHTISNNCTSSPDPLVSVLWLCEQLLPKFPTNPMTVRWLCFLHTTSKNYRRWICRKDQKGVNKKGGASPVGDGRSPVWSTPQYPLRKWKLRKKVKGLYNVKGLSLGLWLDWLNAHLTRSKAWVQSPGPHKEGVVAQSLQVISSLKRYRQVGQKFKAS